MAPANVSVRWAAMVVLTTSKGWPRVVTSNMLRPAPSSRLLNLTGFFSIVCGPGAGARIACVDILGGDVLVCPDQGSRSASSPSPMRLGEVGELEGRATGTWQTGKNQEQADVQGEVSKSGDWDARCDYSTVTAARNRSCSVLRARTSASAKGTGTERMSSNFWCTRTGDPDPQRGQKQISG
jgi:hypothetical protein